MGTFAAAVGDWAHQVEGAIDLVFAESCKELVRQLNALVPVDTGALRASLRASTTAMPLIEKADTLPPVDLGEIMLVIEGLEAGETLFLGYTRSYAAFVHYGANGRPGRPWVDLVAQRWASIVAEQSALVRSRLGL